MEVNSIRKVFGLINNPNLKLSKRNIKCFILIFDLLLINYMKNLEFNLSRIVDSR